MNLKELFAHLIPQIEAEMRACLSFSDPALRGYYGMLLYHLGWADEHLAPAQVSSGKRIRPMLCVLACQAAQGTQSAAQAIPAAAGIELLHNFSLIHDDIEDNSPTRRGRPAVWTLWGVPQAINSGDGMFAIAHLAIDRLRSHGVSCDRIIAVREVFDRACLALTHGQYLDISFESRPSVSVDEYVHMISGKTAALIGASTAIGATLAGSDATAVAHYETFGRELGLAFQIQDDMLGIWGDEALTGKSAESDVATRKKSLPALYALERSEKLRTLYAAPEVDVPAAIAEMDFVGARAFAGQAAREHHDRALEALRASGASGEAGQALFELAESLLGRAA